MKRSRLFIAAGVICAISLSHPAYSQSTASKPNAIPADGSSKDKFSDKAEADLVQEGRQAHARSLLFTLSGEARGFRDQILRARSLARIADSLWSVAPEQGNTLFREAWDAAEKADQESQGSLNLRRSILTLAARRDPQLAEEFLQQLKAKQEENTGKPTPNGLQTGNNLWELPDAAEKRLELAESLLSSGDVTDALRFADPVLQSVTISTLEFLTHLREKDPTAADRRYTAMLMHTGGNALADANTISLLSSYIFTPHMYVVFNRGGGADATMMRASYPRANVAPQMQIAFFQTARAVLLRPQPPPEQDRSTAGIAGKYMVLKRLLPLFERHAPQEIAAAMRGHFEAMSATVSEDVRRSDDEWVRKGITSDPPRVDQERSLLDEIERANSSDERDQLYFKLALLALDKDDVEARVYVNKIADGAFRKRAHAWVDWSLAINAIKTKDVDTALELGRSDEFTSIQRVWVWTQAAKLLANTDRDKASALLDDAISEVRRIERDDVYRPRGFLAVASAYRLVEPSRVWDAISEAVEAANSSEGFTGEGGVLTLTINSKSRILKRTEAVPDFNIEGVFVEAAKTDFNRAVQMAREFKADASRVNATIAVSRSILTTQNGKAIRPAAKR